MENRSKILPPEELVVVNMSEGQVEAAKRAGWFYKLEKDPEIFIIETCERSVLVTSRHHWEDVLSYNIPQFTSYSQPADDQTKESKRGNSKYYHKFVGRGAYQYLLESACGLHSNDVGEEDIARQISLSFDGYKAQKCPHTKLSQIMQKINRDQKVVRTIIGNHYTPSEARCAIDLMKLPPHPSVLLVGDDAGEIKNYARELSKNGGRNNNQASNITIIDTNSTDGSNEYSDFKHKMHNDYDLPLNTISLSNAEELLKNPENLSYFDGIILASPFGKHSEIENKLLSGREELSHKPSLLVVHYEYTPEEERGIIATSSLKNDPRAIVIIPDVIKPEDVQSSLEEERARHAIIIEKGKRACEILTIFNEQFPKGHPDTNRLREAVENQKNIGDVVSIANTIKRGESQQR